jgi:hypothetical protein
MRRFLLWLTLLSTTGCIYDHRVTQAILERRRRAREAEGAKIGKPQAHATQRPIRYSGRVRFYVSDDYRRQHAQWRSSLAQLVNESAAVLGPAFAIELESELREWSPQCDREQLDVCLNELATTDAGGSDVWVVGVLGDTPRFSSSFETLGKAHLVSSHIVLRDVADLAERKAIDDAFPTHTPDQRSKIYAHRRAHKRLAIFLHEWGHTLGGLHSPEAIDLLHASYDDRMVSFGDANSFLIEAALQARYAANEELLRSAAERADASRFAPGEHAKLLARLERKATPTGATSAPTASASAMTTSAPEDLTLAAADRQILLLADSEAEQGASHDAWAHVSPLVDRYPSSQAVQSLACKLSMQLGLLDAAQKSCPRAR